MVVAQSTRYPIIVWCEPHVKCEVAWFYFVKFSLFGVTWG